MVSGVYGFHTPEEEEPTVSGVWRGLKDNTTAHGIPHINNAKGMWKLLHKTDTEI